MIIDAHVHPYLNSKDDFAQTLREAQKYDAQLWLFSLMPREAKPPAHWLPTVAYCRQANDEVIELMRQYPRQIEGFAYINPLLREDAIKELDRCVQEHGMVGMKLWIAVRCSDHVIDPLIERCIRYGIPTIQHTWLKQGGKCTGRVDARGPCDSGSPIPKRHPDHGSRGGDWEIGLRCARPFENVYVDISGGEANSGGIERAIDLVGADRILFGSDLPLRTISSQLAKVLGAQISDEAKEKIVYRNAAGIIARARQSLLSVAR